MGMKKESNFIMRWEGKLMSSTHPITMFLGLLSMENTKSTSFAPMNYLLASVCTTLMAFQNVKLRTTKFHLLIGEHVLYLIQNFKICFRLNLDCKYLAFRMK